MLALHREHAFSDLFVGYLLARNIHMKRIWLTNSSIPAKRGWLGLCSCSPILARRACPTVIPKISQETFAEMVGTTRSRVSFFMNRFRKLGFVDYDSGGMQVPFSFTSQRCSPRLELRTEGAELRSLADLATLGFAISFVTSASVALADSFFAFLWFIMPIISRVQAIRWSIWINNSFGRATAAL